MSLTGNNTPRKGDGNVYPVIDSQKQEKYYFTPREGTKTGICLCNHRKYQKTIHTPAWGRKRKDRTVIIKFRSETNSPRKGTETTLHQT